MIRDETAEENEVEDETAEEKEVEALTSLLVKWVHQPEAEHRLDQVLGAVNGGTIFAQDYRNFTRLSDRREVRVSSDSVCGEPKLCPLWKEVYRTQLRPSEHLAERKRQLICFALVYNALLNTIVALAPLKLPPYVVLEIVDWLPHVEKAPRFFKVRLIENVCGAIKKLETAKNNKEATVIVIPKQQTWVQKYGKQDREWSRLMNSLIVLKGSYTGFVHMNVEELGPQPSGGCLPHLFGKGWIGANYYKPFEEWFAKVDAMPFLKLCFEYTVVVGDSLNIEFLQK